MIIAMGLPGAGKTTVLKNVKSDYVLVNYGDLMFEIEQEHFGIKDRDDMRKLPIEKQKQAQKMVYERLAKMDGKVILDTLCSVNTPSGFFPGLPLDYLKMLKVDSLVLITADVEEVAKRRAEDPTRKRDSDDVTLHDNMNRAFLAAYSAATGAPAVIIFNRQGKLEEAVAQFEKILG
ncbi:adenylate kinase [Candidatus Micrarchaeota archaeon]|nr:adenylate kinase [Candidatus Micrarchaeota archaeon]